MLHNFKELLEGQGSPAADFKPKRNQVGANQKGGDKEATEFEPRSPGEKDFVKDHGKPKAIEHPVATDVQHKANNKNAGEHKGHEDSDPELEASGPKKTFAKFRKMGGYGQKSARPQDKKEGDKKPVMQGSSKIKEEAEIDEAVGVMNKHRKNLMNLKKKGVPEKEVVDVLKNLYPTKWKELHTVWKTIK